jgi:beta-glucanase (GH16 family)
MNKNVILGLFFLSVSADSASQRLTIVSDAEYKLVFSDEFNLPNGCQPDSLVWSRKPRNNDVCNRWNSSSSKVVFIKNGSLVLKAIPNKSEPSDTARMLTGSLWTFGKYNVKYGRIEVRMRTNEKSGNFPAAWLKWQPKDWGKDPYAEIDVMEVFGRKDRSHHTIHSQMTVSDKRHGQVNTFVKEHDVTKWHVYGIEWTPNYVTWMIDGVPIGTYQKSQNKRLLRQGQWTFDVPCYIVLNQSVGEQYVWGMKPDYKATYETRIDWIRVYKKEEE